MNQQVRPLHVKLGWSNPDCGPCSLRLYALDAGDQPRWAEPHARVAEVPLMERGAHEGAHYVLIPADSFDQLRDDLAAAQARGAQIEARARAVVEHFADFLGEEPLIAALAEALEGRTT